IAIRPRIQPIIAPARVRWVDRESGAFISVHTPHIFSPFILFFHNQYAIRSKIKKCFLFKESAQLTKRSVKKFVCLHVLLVGIVVSLEELQEITE
ncbi:MAG: hypothetical protein CW694_02705, partial [Candidatus Syntrophoarchaeum sp. WYZ-LMO15]